MRALLVALALVVGTPPSPARWVTDNTGFLSPEAHARLDARLEAYEQATGHQVVVWIGDTLEGEPIDDWAARTFQAWGLGRRGKDDGLCLFVLSGDRKAAIQVGYGLEGAVTDARAARIIREEMAPRLRAGDPDGAVTAAVDSLLGALGGEVGAPPRQPPVRRDDGGPWSWIPYAIGLFILFSLLTHGRMTPFLVWNVRGGGGRFRGGGGWGGGGGGGGGGGFSGGGGRSGGGGASGSW